MVKVLPKNDEMRKLLKHPSGNIAFRESGSIDWPDDSFTARRVADGDVTIEEDKPAPAPTPAPEPVVQQEPVVQNEADENDAADDKLVSAPTRKN